MHYDTTTLTVRPGTTPSVLPRLDEWLHETRLGGKLLACWFTELGALNQILLIREYENESGVVSDRDQIVRSQNPYGIADMMTGASSTDYRPFPFMPNIQTGSVGPIFEVRTYVLKPNGLSKTMELWRAAVPNRAKLSPLLAAMYSVSGGMSHFMHIWPYRSLDERQRIRAKAVEVGVWPPSGGPDQLLAQRSDIFLAAAFSPIR